MHRRARHFNPGSAGAVIAVDSRFISGLSNNDEVTTWRNIAQANDATSISGLGTPNYITNQLAGQPAVRFENNNALRFSTITSFTASTIICAAKPISLLTGDNNIIYYGNDSSFSTNFNWVGVGKNFASNFWVTGNFNNPTERSVVSTTAYDTNEQIASGLTNDSGVNRIFTKGVQTGTATSTAINVSASARPTLGRRGNQTVGYINADVYAVSLIPSAVSASLRRRLEHAVAFSFKIPCS